MGKKILLIEDEADVAEVAQARLEHSGYEVFVVATAEEGFALIKKMRPDLILLDLLLPKMHGTEACRILKADEELNSIPVILFTATASSVPALTADLKADDYIVKPYDPDDMIAKIKKLID